LGPGSGLGIVAALSGAPARSKTIACIVSATAHSPYCTPLKIAALRNLMGPNVAR
jgi:hypothetical protein